MTLCYMYACYSYCCLKFTQAPSPRKSIVRCDITSVKQINVAEKNHCIELVCGSERWQLSTYTQVGLDCAATFMYVSYCSGGVTSVD